MSEGSDETDTGICLREEIKEEIEAIRKRLEELSAKAESCQGRLRKRDKFKLEGWRGGGRGKREAAAFAHVAFWCYMFAPVKKSVNHSETCRKHARK